ncbi:hypothetical protein QJS04_geneDACA008755 [Acorus gramineus]|uniref:Isopenicillin N synthase-like Fe(2+) 2OG dioxygenase domain-containing protein n=1 Tax=Acorus gramineus TaxID=55184 RepID=A0AAV9AFF9_ACOGR|nr:hypothetical protein QJS04_geneDACA008755 [Acorus gramineus]
MILSNGKFKSISHKSTVKTEKERLSLATFQSSSYDACIGPVPELVRGGEAYYHKSMDHGQFFNIFLSSKLKGKGHMEAVKLQN